MAPALARRCPVRPGPSLYLHCGHSRILPGIHPSTLQVPCGDSQPRPTPTQAVHGADLGARHPAQQPPGGVLGKVALAAEEQPFFLTEEDRALQPGGQVSSQSRMAQVSINRRH